MLAKSSPFSRGPGRLNFAAAVTAVGVFGSSDGGCCGAASGDTVTGASTQTARVDVRQARTK